MAKNEKSTWMGLLIGPLMSYFALVGLWKNETRFDFYRAAADCKVVASAEEAEAGQSIATTGAMDQGLYLTGDYVEAFVGYLMVERTAEVYCWVSERKDDTTRWELKWSERVESDSRNSGIRRRLSSKRFLFKEYPVGDLSVAPSRLAFMNSKVFLPTSELMPQREEFKPEGSCFYLRKDGATDRLGDERVFYRGIPIPSLATYFGEFNGEQGVADTSQLRSGWINRMIQDTGVLHHLVAGDRETALVTMKSQLQMIKWGVRVVGVILVVSGCYVFSSTMLGWLFTIPVIGRLADAGAMGFAIVVGLPLALLTILGSYLVAHPIVLLVLLMLLVGGITYVRRRGRAAQAVHKRAVEQHYGLAVSGPEIKELEFLELAKLGLSTTGLEASEEEFLRRWAKKHGWDDSKYEELIGRARQAVPHASTSTSEEHLSNLMRLAMADGTVSRYEIDSIKEAATRVGYDKTKVQELVDRLRVAC